MKLINNFKKKLGNYILNKEFVKYRKNKEIVSIHEAKKIGILYKVLDETNHDLILEFSKTLQDKNIDVKTLGFVDYKELPHYCHPKIKQHFVTLKNINWYYKPVGDEISDFTKMEFDILIDLSMDNYIPIKYILSHTNAKFIVGKYDEHTTHFYDMMLKVDNSTKINDFIKVVVDYLNIIKNTKNV